jgi:hypothetical protein
VPAPARKFLTVQFKPDCYDKKAIKFLDSIFWDNENRMANEVSNPTLTYGEQGIEREDALSRNARDSLFASFLFTSDSFETHPKKE